ncbi:hypothetical protein E8E15_007147 [Penicillium rubens]|uniref:Pc16g08710 protein n=2 Tax=Penicillium chrysogenum species complex TaxID=254878 RepID=B6H8A6_PENRW|nr:uncharacterized protein N7525_010873 [Penicillium rubens]KAJ5275067.1 hypothetical protein N7505_003612 [Penicillium chrysogenum]CAP93541.1 Pc16g08710 [Penicillium rubens Wisconsin 54-1255]KAF3028453.1 hypothetical protein E8E15_007147 [Penicillium rubens]KAJ5036540.1 hypothetical protein NUH16_004415 [Penicillium rubens]KAJ5821589.1 hypothetical protein N7525_010873 [Penicillium rubens]
MSLLTTYTTQNTTKIAHLTISHAQKLNSLTTPLLTSLTQTLSKLSNTNLHAITLTGAGQKSFIGGADLNELSTLRNAPTARKFITSVHETCTAIRTCPVPVIARINGFALGAGLEIAAACDLRVAAKGAVFGMPEVRLGIPSVVEAALLPGLIGWGRTRQLLLLGGMISASEALRWGLVERVVEDEELDLAVAEWTSEIGRNGPLAVRRQKALISRWEELSLAGGIEAGIEAFGECFDGDCGTEPGRMIGEFFREKERSKARIEARNKVVAGSKGEEG